MTELERANAFEESLRERAADEVIPLPFGSAILTPSLPSVWDLNLLRVDRAGITAEGLAAEADRIMGEAGLAHRRVVTLDKSLAPGIEALGWEPGRFLFMLYRGGGERTGDVALVEEVEHDVLLPIREAMVREAPWADDEETVNQILAAQARGAAAGRSRHFAVVVEGKVASAADLFSDGRTAQVEDVVTQPERRGRGYASAVVLHAVGEARREGHDFVFLVADAEDWPKELYARLGFEAIGHKWTFLRKVLSEGS
jgi:ribosomal protein S18 acetylase RimI-like enzyme